MLWLMAKIFSLKVGWITIAILGIVQVTLIQSTCSDKARYSVQARLYLCLILC